MIEIITRLGVRGKEYVFRFGGTLYVFKDLKKAEIERDRLTNGSLF